MDFEVERKQVDGKLIPLGDNEPDDIDYVTVKLRVTGSASFTPGRKYGPADSCYDDEGEQEIESVTRVFDDKRTEEVGLEFLTDEEQESALEMLCTEIQEGGDEDPPDYEPDYDY